MSVSVTSTALDIRSPLSPAQLKKIFALCMKRLKGTPEYENFKKLLGTPKKMELHYCDDKEMRGYQKKFRKLDRTTDVLSFPSLESPAHNEKHFMGTVIVSLATVKRNSLRYERTFKAELTEVFIHGVLHLLSFDHVKVSLKKKHRMRKIQSEIFQNVDRVLA